MEEARTQFRDASTVWIECGRCKGTGEGNGEGKVCNLCGGHRWIEVDQDPVEPLV